MAGRHVETPWPHGRTGHARTAPVTVAAPAGGNRQGSVTGVLPEAGTRPAIEVPGEMLEEETPGTVARELEIRVRIVAEAEAQVEVAIVSATAACPVAAVVGVDLEVLPALSAAAQEAARGAAVHAAHPAWALPGAAVAPGGAAAGGGGE
jgi:hypothetical protein